MIKKIIENTEKYVLSCGKYSRKDKGQFFTPLSIVNFMAQKASKQANHLDILDPGAGNGILATAIVKYCLDFGMCKSFNVRFVENDKDILPVLRKTKSLLTDYVNKNQGIINISISEQNYITGDENGLYDIVICNPPYKKIRKNADESVCMKDYVYGQPNMYALFMCKAIHNLKIGGKFSFITPRSWTSGKYYRDVRKFVLRNLNLTDLLLFESRNNVFGDEQVLQETLITIGEKNSRQTQNINVFLSGGEKKCHNPMVIDAKMIKSVGENEYLLLPSSEEDLFVIKRMNSIPDTFESLGYCFKTGPVVEFRNKCVLSKNKKNGYVPMYRSANIIDGTFVFPANIEKSQYVSIDEKKLLIPDMNTVLLRRLSAKEERRRLQSCVYYKSGEYPYISMENHVNYLVRIDGQPLTVDEVEWIHGLLMSDEYDSYYRIINKC